MMVDIARPPATNSSRVVTARAWSTRLVETPNSSLKPCGKINPWASQNHIFICDEIKLKEKLGI
jgi:hypothetical protein